ncbi:hypothetical protein AB685_04025 [Bacillus sp. LL01]|nr:hypothetical protein AB685_04025 [Bacillus sp. LL01]
MRDFLAGAWSKRRRLQRESSDNLETPQRSEEAQGRPAESAAFCGKQQRRIPEAKGKRNAPKQTAKNRRSVHGH